jgi:hypothetical protein
VVCGAREWPRESLLPAVPALRPGGAHPCRVHERAALVEPEDV